MQSKRELTAAQKTLIAFLIAAGLAALVYFLYVLWTQPPCPTCHIEHNSSKPGSYRSPTGCYINGRTANWGMTVEAVVADLGGEPVSDPEDDTPPVPGYLNSECVNIPAPCSSEKMFFSVIGRRDETRVEQKLCDPMAEACPICE